MRHGFMLSLLTRQNSLTQSLTPNISTDYGECHHLLAICVTAL